MSVAGTISAIRGRLLLLALTALATGGALFAITGTSAGGTRVNRLHVSGNRILDKNGRQVLFQGVNRSGTEYACVQGWGLFDGPNTAGSVQAIASWHVNIVRVLINEDCWLGINGIKPDYAGANYRQAILDYIQLLHRHGMYAEVSLIWAAPGSHRATYQPAAPDEDHAPALWASLASAFRHDPDVILAPWGETTVSAGCFLHGGCQAPYGANAHYRVAGMQQAVTVMRRAGYNGIIAIPGINYANDLSHWLSHMPRDPRHQLVAEAHVYGGQTCGDVRCYQSTYAPVARRVPLIFGETGENAISLADCGSNHISTIVRWADSHRVGYEAWSWDTWGNCGILIRNYAGQPFSAYGRWIRSHYLRRRPRLIPGQ